MRPAPGAKTNSSLLGITSSTGPLMPTRRQFRFHKDTIALETIRAKRVAITIPAGQIIEVVGDPDDGDAKIEILWAGRIVTIFTVDLQGHGTEITAQQAKLGTHGCHAVPRGGRGASLRIRTHTAIRPVFFACSTGFVPDELALGRARNALGGWKS